MKERVINRKEEVCNDMTKGIPEGLAQIKWGGAENLRNAVLKKQAHCTTKDGVDYYSWREFSSGTMKTKINEFEASQSMKVDSQQFRDAHEHLCSLKWNFELSAREQKAFADSGTLPKSCKESVQKAITATSKACEHAQKILNSFPKDCPRTGIEAGDTLKKCVKANRLN